MENLHLEPMWLRTSCLAPHLPAHAPASTGVECPRSRVLFSTSAGGLRAARGGSTFWGMYASVASWTRSDRLPGVEDTRGVRCAAVEVSPRTASFRGAGSEAGSWKMKPTQGSTRRGAVVERADGEREREEMRTSVDEWPGARVHGAPDTAPLRKVPPVPVCVAEHVAPGLFVVV
jgi:hypothetical protein